MEWICMETEPKEPHPQHDRYFIYALRTAHQNQMQLNLMADQKANILVGSMLIVLTMVISRLYTMPDTETWLRFILGLFVIIETIALGLAIRVIMPRNIRTNHASRIEDVANPLFFGCFSAFPENEYTEYIVEQVHTDQTAIHLFVRDFYQLGRVLDKKYALLKYAYIFAVGGVVLPVVLFTGELVIR